MRRRVRLPRSYFAYLLRCGDGTYYAGYTVDPGRRLEAHRRGVAARYTRGRGPVRIVAVWRCGALRAALRLERKLKGLSHAEKRHLAGGASLADVLPEAGSLGARRLARVSERTIGPSAGAGVRITELWR
jgi:putative endonuclease